MVASLVYTVHLIIHVTNIDLRNSNGIMLYQYAKFDNLIKTNVIYLRCITAGAVYDFVNGFDP